jgi:hypothetical protein
MKIELAVIQETTKYFSIHRPPRNFKGKTFTVPKELLDDYLFAKRELQNIQDRIIYRARKQGAHPPLKDKPIIRYEDSL